MAEPGNNRRELKYLMEFFMLATFGLITWTLISTVETSRTVAVLSADFQNMKESFTKLETAVGKSAEDRFDGQDAKDVVRELKSLISERTRNRYYSSDAESDKKEILAIIRNHTH